MAPTDLLSSFQVRKEREEERRLILDPEIGPERPPDDLGLGAAVLLRTSFERFRFVLMQIAHLPDETAAGEGLPGSSRCRFALWHGREHSVD